MGERERKIRERRAISRATAYYKKIERKADKKVVKFIEGQIRKSDKAPLGWNRKYYQAKYAAIDKIKPIMEKVKKGKLGAGWLWLMLIIIVPILVVVFLILNREVDFPPDEEFRPQIGAIWT